MTASGTALDNRDRDPGAVVAHGDCGRGGRPPVRGGRAASAVPLLEKT